MRTLLYLLFFFFAFNLSAQEAEIKAEAVNIDNDESSKFFSKKKKKRKKRSSTIKINYNASNLWDAINPILGPGAYLDNGRVLFNSGALFSTSNKYAEWAVNGTLMGQNIPMNIEIQDIDDVNVLRSTIETSKYGLRGSGGVIEITLKKY